MNNPFQELLQNYLIQEKLEKQIKKLEADNMRTKELEVIKKELERIKVYSK